MDKREKMTDEEFAQAEKALKECWAAYPKDKLYKQEEIKQGIAKLIDTYYPPLDDSGIKNNSELLRRILMLIKQKRGAHNG